MIDEHDVREMLQRRASAVPAAPTDTPRAVQRARRRLAMNGAVAMLAVVAIAGATLAGIDAIRSAPVPADTAPVIRGNGEVLRFTGRIVPGRLDDDSFVEPTAGDLVAVDPLTGEERVLVEDLYAVYSARWSADGRWYAYETDSTEGVSRDLWVAGGSQAPRVVATSSIDGGGSFPGYWNWSPAGAKLATIEQYPGRLRTIDVATGETTVVDLGDDLAGNAAWAWSPDGTHLVFSHDGSIYSVDVRSGERSLLARLPVASPFYANKILWSPDGAHIAVRSGEGDLQGRLFVMDADGSDILLVSDDNNSLGVAWSPDGTRLAFGEVVDGDHTVRIRVVTADGADPAEIGTMGLNPCLVTSYGTNYECLLTWSPDGTQVAILRPQDRFTPFRSRGGAVVFPATGAGEGKPLDRLTFLGWDGGWYLGEGRW